MVIKLLVVGKLKEQYWKDAVNEYLTSTGLDLAAITASKAGYTFKGWKDENGAAFVSPWAYTTDKTAVAQWEAKTYIIKVFVNFEETGRTVPRWRVLCRISP